MELIDVKRAVKPKDERFVNFSHYKDGCLFYETDFGEVFPVPLEDTGTAEFKSKDKALLFMRYMVAFNKEAETFIEMKEKSS